MPRVVLDRELPLDHLGHPPRRPEPRRVSEALRSAPQEHPQALELSAFQQRLAPRPPRLPQSPTAGFRKCPRPAVHRLPVHTHKPSYLRLRDTLAQKLCCLQPSALQRLKVPSNPCWIAHAQKRSRNPGKCHYILRYSITKERRNSSPADAQLTRSDESGPTAAGSSRQHARLPEAAVNDWLPVRIPHPGQESTYSSTQRPKIRVPS